MFIADSFGFTGSVFYVVEGGSRITQINDGRNAGSIYTAGAGKQVTCVGIGDLGREVVLFGEDSGGSGTIYYTELGGGTPTLIATYGAGSCKYVMQQGTLVYWTTTLGELYTFDLTSTNSTTGRLSPVASLNGANGGVTSVTKKNALLYASNTGANATIRQEPLDLFAASSPALPPADSVWETLPLNSSDVRGIVTLNDAIIVATNSGIRMYFQFFSGPFQSTSRSILVGLPGIRGLATDVASTLSMSLVLFVFCIGLFVALV